MTDGPALLRSILEAPGEDTPRLAYADWLAENDALVETSCPSCAGHAADPANPWGEAGYRPERDPGSGRYEGGWCNCQACNFMGGRPGIVIRRNGFAQRAEFIRVQCEIAILTAGFKPENLDCLDMYLDPDDRDDQLWKHKVNALRRRERELIGGPTRPPPPWASYPCPGIILKWSRGFVSSLTCTAADFLAHAGRIFARHPVTAVTLTDRGPARATDQDRTYPEFRWFKGDVTLAESDRVSPATIAPVVFDCLRGGVINRVDWCHWYDTRAEALAALSAACAAHGRALAGLPPLTPPRTTGG